MNRMACAVVVTVVLGAALIAGCSPAPPDREPDIRGVVSDVTEGTERPSFLVAGTGAYDRAFVSQTEDTEVLTRDGNEYSISDEAVAKGDRIEVWFTGPVAESYPVQATAETIVIER